MDPSTHVPIDIGDKHCFLAWNVAALIALDTECKLPVEQVNAALKKFDELPLTTRLETVMKLAYAMTRTNSPAPSWDDVRAMSIEQATKALPLVLLALHQGENGLLGKDRAVVAKKAASAARRETGGRRRRSRSTAAV